MRIIELNLNQRSGYSFDGDYSFSANEIAKMEADIFVLTEFYRNGNWEKTFKKALPGYQFIHTKNEIGQNDILMCISESFQVKNVEMLYCANDNNNPNYLQVELCDGGMEWVEIGIRFRTELYHEQIKILNEKLLELKAKKVKVMLHGDFNAFTTSLLKNISQGYKVCSPEHHKDYWYTERFIDNYSFLFTTPNKEIKKGGCLDHMICSPDIIVDDISYNWDFISQSNIYPSRQELLNADNVVWCVPVGMPDHAMLVTSVRLSA